MNAERKWTPGPWRIGRSADNTPLVMVPTPASEGSGFGVACINRLPRMGSVRGDIEANAHLIAAAPDMYEALAKSAEGWANAIELGLLPPQHITSAEILRDEARAALSKAEGR